ncbi:hypothetical protein B0A49_02196 [Cryomyces minteri]|uniref:Uncharacterized protein n=1 Tax=Cryomyces minteri TaxID=331657 RepID=A0A4U0XKB9_9PEZI|nr:hypothetical protein B0A49_02196 [Cryomyces minteri]
MENGEVTCPKVGDHSYQDGDDSHHNGDDHTPMAPVSKRPKTAGSTGHKRSLSGSILSRLSFLRSSPDELPPHAKNTELTEEAHDEDTTPKKGGAMANAVRQVRGRKRKGSLRKTALLGTGKLRLEGRERRNSILQRAPSTRQTASTTDHERTEVQSPTPLHGEPTPRRFSYESPVAASSSENGWPEAVTLATTKTQAAASPEDNPRPVLGSPIASPTSNPYASTTDEDDTLSLSFSRPPAGSMLAPATKKPSSSAYLATTTSLARRRSSQKKPRSPLATAIDHTYPYPSSPPAHDYSATAWWGWVVLITTWIVFVVGMGSCLEVWSWAWDVGETPYAPPELEDDPTLPIVGYYPALMVLTTVMAWVWVVVAWVGMKYFKHAKIQGEDT